MEGMEADKGSTDPVILQDRGRMVGVHHVQGQEVPECVSTWHSPAAFWDG